MIVYVGPIYIENYRDKNKKKNDKPANKRNDPWNLRWSSPSNGDEVCYPESITTKSHDQSRLSRPIRCLGVPFLLVNLLVFADSYPRCL